jgi:hypothetical protein
MFVYTQANVANPISHFRAWRLQKNFPLDAQIEMLVNVPRWSPGGQGHDFWHRALSKLPKGGTVAQAIALGKAIGLTAGEVQQHLRWLYTWGDQVQIGGHTYIPVVPAPAVPAQADVTAPAAPAPAPKAKKAKAVA